MSNPGLRRLAALYGRVEAMRAREVAIAASAVGQVRQSIELEQQTLRSRLKLGREALSGGDGELWLQSEQARQRTMNRVQRLTLLQSQREIAKDAALVEHRQSRLRMEQVAAVLARKQALEAEVLGRQEQTAADDRFGSRLAWAASFQEDD